jgi:hypothetical protein
MTAVSKPNNMPAKLAMMTALVRAAPPMDFSSTSLLRASACWKAGKQGTVSCQRCHIISVEPACENA